MPDYVVSSIVDASGMVCPMPIIKAKKAMDLLKEGEVLEFISTDPGTQADLLGFIGRMGYELLDQQKTGNLYRFFIKKT